ncbi:MAG: hypothetical protein ThorAB25_18540 [Candidatus Thorarchaeota archaeon AB_25]|nr:MAG: hypothetical protein ThorAB25_18540 [Candidatus Thorarchaeota archaeon AB_25]
MSKFIDKMIEHDIDTLNDHLPESRVPLSDLIGVDSPQFRTRIGEVSVFRVEEIEDLTLEVPEKYHELIRLPIVVLRRLDYGSGIYTVAGNKTELFMVHRIIGYVDLEWEDLGKWKPVEKLARPQVQILRRKLPSTTSIGIGMSSKEKPGFNLGQ